MNYTIKVKDNYLNFIITTWDETELKIFETRDHYKIEIMDYTKSNNPKIKKINVRKSYMKNRDLKKFKNWCVNNGKEILQCVTQ